MKRTMKLKQNQQFDTGKSGEMFNTAQTLKVKNCCLQFYDRMHL